MQKSLPSRHRCFQRCAGFDSARAGLRRLGSECTRVDECSYIGLCEIVDKLHACVRYMFY